MTQNEEILVPSDSFSKAMKSFLTGTFLSRIGGFIRDLSMAFCFGTEPAIAAFLVAFRFSNLFRRIFGEGALLNGFIPYFEMERSKSPQQAAFFYRDILFSVFAILVAIVILLCSSLFYFSSNGLLSPANYQICYYMMIMLPGVVFICLYTISSALLQCEKDFFIPSIAPLLTNVVWILAIWIYKDADLLKAGKALSIAIVIAYILQWLFVFVKSLIYYCKYCDWKTFFQINLFPKAMRKMLASVSFGVLGVSAMQINTALDSIFARLASLEGPAYLNYAIHIHQLPLALFGIGISTTILPTLARYLENGKHKEFEEVIKNAIEKLHYFLIPSMFAMLALAGVAVNMLYGRGHFGTLSISQTSLCLIGYGLGIVPMGLITVLASIFYAKKDYKSPSLASIKSIIANIIFNFLFVVVFQWGAVSVAISTSLAAFLNVFLLANKISEDYPLKRLIWSDHSKLLLKSAIVAFALTVVLESYFFQHSIYSLIVFNTENWTRLLFQQILELGVLSLIFFSSFYLVLLLITHLTKKTKHFAN